jgi:small ubiquitin-related modifier
MAAADDVKPDIKGDKPEVVTLKLRNADGAETIFKVKWTTKFSKIMEAYCKKFGLEQGGIRLVFDGSRLDEHESPESANLEDGDVIEVRTFMIGGFAW